MNTNVHFEHTVYQHFMFISVFYVKLKLNEYRLINGFNLEKKSTCRQKLANERV